MSEELELAEAAPIGEGGALVPIEEKTIDFYGDTLYAVRVEGENQHRVYVPIKPISDALGLSWSGQSERIRRDPELSEVMRLIRISRINSPGGRPELLAVPLEFLAGWLFGIRTNLVKEELREKIRRYKLECYQALNAHFQGEALIRREGNSSLAQIRGMALAIAEMAEQQMILEGRVDTLDIRLNRAAEVVGSIQRRLTTIEQRLTPATAITDEQAQNVAATVKALAELLGGKEKGKNHYQGIFAELYRRFGVTSYKLIRQDQYEAVLSFLDDWKKSSEE